MQPKTKKTFAPKRQWLKSQIVLTSILFGLMAPPSAHADEAEEISKLVQQGALDKALARTDAYLANRPKDPQIRFLKGIILAERNRINDSIGIFTKLTEDYPELPEPYNNLAVLYAGKGDYDKARESLEMAIRTHPSYATAHENLGDIYAKMASQSYDKALQLDGRNQAAQNKLSMIRNLIAGKPLPESQALAPQPPNNTKSKPAESVAQNNRNKTSPEYAQAPSQPVVSSAPVVQEPPKPTSAPSSGAGISASKPTAMPPPPMPKEKTTIGGDAQVLAAVERWAKAWSSQDIKTYLDSYSQEFDPPGKMNRKVWEKMREDRIVGKESIRVVIETPSITMAGDRAVVKFKQNYYSNKLNNISMKILNLKLEGGQWRIVSERVGG